LKKSTIDNLLRIVGGIRFARFFDDMICGMKDEITRPAAPSRSVNPAMPDIRLRATDLVNEIEFLAARARSLGSARANEMLAPLDLKVRSYSILALACSGKGPSQRELAEFLSLDPSQIVALVDGLEARRLVKRAPDPSDRRSKIISATAEGRRLYVRATVAVQQADDISLRALSAGDREQLRTLLRRIAFDEDS